MYCACWHQHLMVLQKKTKQKKTVWIQYTGEKESNNWRNIIAFLLAKANCPLSYAGVIKAHCHQRHIPAWWSLGIACSLTVQFPVLVVHQTDDWLLRSWVAAGRETPPYLLKSSFVACKLYWVDKKCSLCFLNYLISSLVFKRIETVHWSTHPRVLCCDWQELLWSHPKVFSSTFCKWSF